MAINITSAKPIGDHIRIVANGEFDLKIPLGLDSAYVFFGEATVILSQDDTRAIQHVIDALPTDR
ncbi:hypothetical protein [Pararhizobium qamdonense]|uniref:hypothetical protein n=1 Tax=Pararhizobium qamdonense TaxID=3031126 RepID=UPI0023E12AAB|nr:hypothetical protein [Pararhizobium qamdonense]